MLLASAIVNCLIKKGFSVWFCTSQLTGLTIQTLFCHLTASRSTTSYPYRPTGTSKIDFQSFSSKFDAHMCYVFLNFIFFKSEATQMRYPTPKKGQNFEQHVNCPKYSHNLITVHIRYWYGGKKSVGWMVPYCVFQSANGCFTCRLQV